MTDASGSPTPTGQPAPPGSRAGSGGVKAFFSTTTGRIVLIVAALASLAAILAIIAVIVLGVFLGSSVQQVEEGVVPGGTSPSAPASAQSTAAAVPDVQNRRVFTPRNPFEPVFLPATHKATATTSNASTDPNTLTLTDIVEENGVRKGVFSLGGTTYTVGAGERLGSTPWQVVSLSATSATMMYGDSQVVLTVGQGVVTK